MMWNEQEYYARSRSNSFSGHAPAMYDHRRASSPAYPTPQTTHEMPQPMVSQAPQAPMSSGGFTIPQHGFDPPLPPPDWSDRGRSADRGIDLSRGHADPYAQTPHRRHRHSHSHEPVYVQAVQAAPQEHHRHKHRHRHGHHSHQRPSSHSRIPNIIVHSNGQTYSVPPHPIHQHNAGTPVYTTATSRPPRPAHNGSHSNAAMPITTTPQMQMPVARLPPSEAQYYGPEIEKKRHYFQYSQCNGRKKALCIGINYEGQENQLNGCINDAKKMRNFLIKRYGFQPGDIVLLTDDGKSRRERPTKRNIMDAMHWLVREAHSNDSLVFHYSGHGGQTRDLDGDETDGYDEVIYPSDFKKAGHIVDDDMHTIMVKSLPAGCRLTAIFDCCHSGSALDLPYMYGTGGKLKREPNLVAARGNDTFGDQPFNKEFGIGHLTRAFDGMMRRSHHSGNAGKQQAYAARIKTSPADVISWSGCKDSQTSADTYENNVATGAMSYAFMSSLKEKPDQTYQELLINIRRILKHQFSQKPQLSSSHPIDTTVKFIL